jgi:hypothetical protein
MTNRKSMAQLLAEMAAQVQSLKVGVGVSNCDRLT